MRVVDAPVLAHCGSWHTKPAKLQTAAGQGIQMPSVLIDLGSNGSWVDCEFASPYTPGLVFRLLSCTLQNTKFPNDTDSTEHSFRCMRCTVLRKVPALIPPVFDSRVWTWP